MDMTLDVEPAGAGAQPAGHVELLTAADAVVGSQTVATDSVGSVTVTDNPAAMKVRVTDPFGNSATSILP